MITDTDKDILPQHYILELYERYLALQNACIKVKAAVHDSGDYLPVYVPTCSSDKEEQRSVAAREAALKSITQLFHLRENEYLAEAGILCASPKTVATIEQLNKAKDDFKKAVSDIRAHKIDKDIATAKIDKLISDEMEEKGKREGAIKDAMTTAGIGSLNLKRCYAKIRIMPEHLDVFSWTWATTHSRSKQVTIEEAMKLARSLKKDVTRDIAIDILSQCPLDEILLRKISLPNQLRANYAYKDNDILTRKSCPVSGIVIAQQTNLPRMVWRKNPAITGVEVEKLERLSTIEHTALVDSLHLYRYVR
jgi:hypothetical protein